VPSFTIASPLGSVKRRANRVVGAEIAQQAFGVAGAQRRAVHLDPVVAQAVRLLQGVKAPAALFDRVAAANAGQKPLAKR
jgi:hypothetical protein